MGNWFFKKPAPVVLVPPMFDFPPLATRTMMLESSYDLLFGKLARHYLFEDYLEQPWHFSTRIMLKPIDDPHVDLIATSSGPFHNNSGEDILVDASFRWQRDLDDPHTFLDLYVSNADEILRLRSCARYPEYGVAAFGVFPLLVRRRILSEDYGFVGLRYGSENLAMGATVFPFPLAHEYPRSAWLVGQLGSLTAGVHYKPDSGSKICSSLNNPKNWSWAVAYGSGSISPMSPSFNCSLEFAKSSQLIASFYQHLVVQRKVKNPFEEDMVVGITNYIDFGFELGTRMGGDELQNAVEKSNLHLAASWQANKNFLLKGKLGTLSSSIALAFKSWWRPSFTFNISAVGDHKTGKTAFGFGIRIEYLREASYQRADPNYVMLIPSMKHLAEGIARDIGKRPMLQSDIYSGNFDGLPRPLKPIGNLL